MSSYQLWFSTAIFFEILVLGSLLALPVLWIRMSNLANREDRNLYWQLLISAILFALGAIAGLRMLQAGIGQGIDNMTVWFLPLVGTLILHGRITHNAKDTLEIGVFFLVVSYPVAFVRGHIATFLFAIPE